ncbi:MAG: glycosyltransferase family 2 protein [Candidatus Nanohalobium sp.]
MLEPVMWALYAVVLFISFFLIIVLFDEGRIEPESEMLDEFPTLSLIIPAYNEEDTIEMTIESALELDYPEERYEIIAVNDGSTDSTLEKIKQYEDNPRVTVIDKGNGGKGSALNAGVRESDSEVVACVDADSKLEEKSLKHIVSEMGDDHVGVASAMKVYQPQNMLQKLQWVEYVVGIFTRNIMGLINAIHVTPGPLSAYRREKLVEVGMFDEDSLVEDQEICFRLQEKHYTIGHASKAEVRTVAPSTLKGFYRQRYRWYRGSLETAIQYKHMIFNREYGDLGMFAIPAKLAQTVLSLFVLFLTVYLIGVPLATFVSQFSRLGLDYFTFAATGFSEIVNGIYWAVLSMQLVTLAMIGTLFTTSAAMAYMASHHTDENLLEHGLIPVVLYLAFFVFINGFLWLIVILKMIVGSERTW